MLLPRLVSTLGVSVAGTLLYLALFTRHCEAAVTCSFVALGMLPCCIAGLCGVAHAQARRNDEDGTVSREVARNGRRNPTFPNSTNEGESSPVLAVCPNGETQLAVPIKTEDTFSENQQQKQHEQSNNEFEFYHPYF
eukprot:g3318.t1